MKLESMFLSTRLIKDSPYFINLTNTNIIPRNRYLVLGGSDGTFRLFKGVNDEEGQQVDVGDGQITSVAARVCLRKIFRPKNGF